MLEPIYELRIHSTVTKRIDEALAVEFNDHLVGFVVVRPFKVFALLKQISNSKVSLLI